MAPTQQRSLLATLTAVFVFLMQADPTSGAGFTCAGTGCIAAALLVGINAVVQAHGGSGQTGAMIPAKRDEGSIAFNHITHEGVVHNFINTTALTHDWHFVHAVNQPVNLTVRRLSDGRIHARTQGFSNMPCTDDCPSEDLAACDGLSPALPLGGSPFFSAYK